MGPSSLDNELIPSLVVRLLDDDINIEYQVTQEQKRKKKNKRVRNVQLALLVLTHLVSQLL
jgi:hypothetical protein